MIYLLHFERPISPNHTAQHYIGYAEDIDARFESHLENRGARLTQVANERRIGYEIVRTWAGGRNEERKLKARKNAPKLCPICKG
jgi:predicted GIY-YIG superfamily endonuclease